MSREVRRLFGALAITPALIAETPGARLQVMCRLCMTPREVDVTRTARLERYWSQDLETVFAQVVFRCRCGGHAHALRVTRPTRDASEVLLLVSTQRRVNG